MSRISSELGNYKKKLAENPTIQQLSHKRWLAFQAISITAFAVCMLVAVPLYITILRPDREANASRSVSNYTCSDDEKQALLDPRHDRYGVQDHIVNMYKAREDRLHHTARFMNRTWLDSILNLTMSAEKLDPDSSSLQFRLEGRAFGRITYNGNNDLLLLSVPSTQVYVPTGVRSCRQPLSEAPACADLVLECGGQQLSYSTGHGLGRSIVVVGIDAVRGRDNYPFDAYTATGVVKASIAWQLQAYYEKVLQAQAIDLDIENGSVPAEELEWAHDMSQELWELANETYHNSFDALEYTKPVFMQLQLQASIPGWTVTNPQLHKTVERIPQRVAAYISGDASEVIFLERPMLVYSITYTRSTFTKVFAIAIVVVMWALSIYLAVIAVDHVIVRPRRLEPDTVGYSVGMLFALPALRLLLDAPFGSYIDFLGFAWNMVLVSISVFIFFTGIYMDHKHEGRRFKRHDGPEKVLLHEDTQKQLADMMLSIGRGKYPPV